MARRSDHSREELKDLILETAWAIVGKQGLEGLTARRVATEIGYAPGTIYNLFSSMDELCLHINARTLDLLYEALAAPVCNNPKQSPSENMAAMARQYMAFAREYRPYWLMLFAPQMGDGRKAQDWYQQKIERLFGPLEILLEPYFTAQQKQKRRMAARILWSSVHGLCFLQETGKIVLPDGKTSAEEMARYLVDTFVTGISG